MIERSEFVGWRNSEVYEEFRKHFQEMLSEKAAELVNRKQPDGNRDMYIRGVIAAYAEVVEWEPEFAPLPESEEPDEV
jgi:hypothetical protein